MPRGVPTDDATIAAIHRALINGQQPLAAIAEHHGVSRRTVQRVRRGDLGVIRAALAKWGPLVQLGVDLHGKTRRRYLRTLRGRIEAGER
jgi:hypothetical protein